MSTHPLPRDVAAVVVRLVNLDIAERQARDANGAAWDKAMADARAQCAGANLDPEERIPDDTAQNYSKTSTRYLSIASRDPAYIAAKDALPVAHRARTEAVDHLYQTVIASPLGSIRPELPKLYRTALPKGWRYRAQTGAEDTIVRRCALSDYRAAAVSLHLDIDRAALSVSIYWSTWSFHRTDALAQREALRRPQCGASFGNDWKSTDSATFTAVHLRRAGGIALPLSPE